MASRGVFAIKQPRADFKSRLRRPTMPSLFIKLLRFYQRNISGLKPASCRFMPRCSDYACGAIEKYGLMRGSIRALWRIIRCHPFSPGGYDPA